MICIRRASRLALVTIIPIVAWLLSAAPVAAAEAQAEDDYAVLIAHAKLEPWTTDFTKLRIQFTKTPAYRPNEKYTDEDKAIEAAIAAADWPRATELVLALLEKNFLRIRSHIYAITIYDKSDNPERGFYHRAFFDGLLGSIFGGGDGRSAAAAFVVISGEEEDEAIRLINYRLESRRLYREAGKTFDVVTVRHRYGGEPVELYFDVSLPWKNSPQSAEKTPS